jgi:AAA+ ATPase superfamily predicted ATPase
MDFVNRSEKLALFRHHSKHADFLVLFGRRRVGKTALIQSYEHSCQALHIDKAVRKNFVNFSLVGGIPRYWKFLRENPDSITAADELFFDKHALLSEEPDRLLKDEAIEGNVARSVLEAIGRGARRPVEIAVRLGMQQNTLSKTFQILIQTSLVQRRIPFGESPKTSKKGIYVIQDPCLRFWYEVFSPHRSRWSLYPREKQRRLIEEHTSHILEDIWRQQFVGAESYWERSIAEFDCVRYADEKLKTLIVSEVKWPRVSAAEKKSLKRQIEEKFHACALSKSFRLADVEIISFEEFAQKSHNYK